MRLLFDANLSPRLPKLLDDLFPGSEHVFPHELEASDKAIWQFAAEKGFVVVTKDDDFVSMALLLGPPPKVIEVRLGNCRTSSVADLLRREADQVLAFGLSANEALLVLA